MTFMASQSTLSRLKAIEPQLRNDGVCALYLFGSVARGDGSEQSDVDLMFDIAPGSHFSLFDQARISRQLSEMLHAKVDFIPRRSLHPFIKARVEAEKKTVFN
jgi:predicted nucleotidyltransferase